MKESLTNTVPAVEAPAVLPPGAPAAAPVLDGLAELKALEAQVSTAKPGRKETEAGSAEPGSEAASAGKSSRRKFKVRPENTFRMALRQYWRLRDWLARRSLGLPSDYAGVFIQGKDEQLVEPLIDPVIGVLETYAPDAIVFIEEKSPLLQLFIALAEVEQSFGANVAAAAAELKAKNPAAPENAAGPSAEKPRPSFPSLNETVGKTGRVSA